MRTEAEGQGARDRELGDVHKRHTAIYNPATHNAHVTVIGLGNIGSHTTLALARMGIATLTLVDFDTVEVHNLASQAYRLGDVDARKVDALSALVAEVSDARVLTVPEAYSDAVPVTPVTVIAVDSMATRRDIARKLADADTFIIDGRLGGGQVEVHTGTVREWGTTLTSEADTDPCSARYISYTSYLVAGLIADTLKRHLLGEPVQRSVYFHADTLEVLKV